jgi:acyl carrier protein
MPTSQKEISDYITSYFGAKLSEDGMTKRIRDLKIDSLDLVEFLMALEEKFDVEIDADEIDQDMTLKQFCELVAPRK